jgi:hypothetical protein
MRRLHEVPLDLFPNMSRVEERRWGTDVKDTLGLAAEGVESGHAQVDAVTVAGRAEIGGSDWKR